MDAKSIHTLELGKILERLSRFTAFSASTALALALAPATELEEVRRRQQETTEARKLLTVKPDLTIGGARDVRASAQSAAIGAVLEAGQVLDVKNTLIAGRIISDPKNGPYLQEAIITQRDGRYVIPLKADFKNRIRGIVHDQSASGATLFIEPLTTVELNNTWRELQLAELQEIRRILTALSALIGLQAARIVGAVEILAQIDLSFAKARYAEELRAHEPALHAIRPRP